MTAGSWIDDPSSLVQGALMSVFIHVYTRKGPDWGRWVKDSGLSGSFHSRPNSAGNQPPEVDTASKGGYKRLSDQKQKMPPDRTDSAQRWRSHCMN